MNEIRLPIKSMLLEKHGGAQTTFEIIDGSNIGLVQKLRDEVSSGIERKIYSASSNETLDEYLAKGVIIGAFVDSNGRRKLIAFSSVVIDDTSEYANELGWPKKEQETVADLEDCIVSREYRGNGLQKILIQIAEMVAESLGKKYCMASVSPENKYSLNNLTDLGYVTRGTHNMHGGLSRLIVKKGIGEKADNRALIVVDYTNDFVANDGKLTAGEPAQEIQENIASKITKYIQSGKTVYIMRDVHDDDYSHPETWLFPQHNMRGTQGRELYGKVKDAVEGAKLFSEKHLKEMDKTKYSAFHKTDLADDLANNKINQVEICGVVTEICVLLTAADAYNYGCDIIIDSGSTASFDNSAHRFALNYFENVLGATVIDKC